MDAKKDAKRWRAVVRRDGNADGRFVYSVKTTGVYCRPSCAARLALRENVEFHLTRRTPSERGSGRAGAAGRTTSPLAVTTQGRSRRLAG